ncbi:MAG: hypothetical protein QM796_16630 [Chthoniobacteraceae bacterium]
MLSICMRNNPDEVSGGWSGIKSPVEMLATERVESERKVFFFDLKQNQRGRFLKVSEDANGHRNTIIVPAAGLRDVVLAMARMLELEKNLAKEDAAKAEAVA